MSWLTPLGFLGLSGLLVLLLIYLLKPNYQQKVVSSTFIWKRSLKYRKRKNPISKIRNLLILLCQIFIIAACAFVLAQPAIADEVNVNTKEKVLVIDASASMLVTDGDETRFERAVFAAKEYADTVLLDGGTVSVILAGKQAEFLAFRITEEGEKANGIDGIFDSLVSANDFKCTFGTGDVDGAMALAETVTIDNPQAEVLFYTGTTYLDTGNVTVVDVSEAVEWNVAVLGCTAVLDEGYYHFDVEAACYGRDIEVNVICEIRGINYEGMSVKYSAGAHLSGDKTVTVQFYPANESVNPTYIYAYESVDISIEINDSFLYDNTFHLDGGTKRTVNIQYASSKLNPFFSTLFLSTVSGLRDDWDIQVKDVVTTREKPALEGFDFYVFEHEMPSELPHDGVVLLADIDDNAQNLLGCKITQTQSTTKDDLFVFSLADPHPITQYVTADIGVTKYTRIIDWDTDVYTPLMYCEGDPVILCRNDADTKVIVMAFNINASDMAMSISFPSLVYGMFRYYFPLTTDGNVFDVNADITVNARGTSLIVTGNDASMAPIEIISFPETLSLDDCGIYYLTQTLMNGTAITDTIYVRVPIYESNITKEVQVLTNPVMSTVTETVYYMYVLFAILGVMIVLLFVEWWLHSRSGN